MSTLSKFLRAAAGNAGGAGLDIPEAFSTFLWDGTGSTRTITNNIDLSGEGGLVWIKKRSGSANHTLQDTVRGATKHIRSSGDSSESTEAQTITAFNSNGFSLGTDDLVNASSSDYVGWTFRKAPKFFDVVTWTGDGTSNRTLSHSLGSTPGMIIAKSTSTSTQWMVWHTAMVDNEFLRLNTTDAQGGYGSFYEAGITSTTIGVSSTSANYGMNINGATYVAYLFAHNNSDGGFGPDADQDIIKCGSYTGNGSATGPEINLGFEPQFVMVKNSSSTGGWQVMDTTRGMPVGNDDARLQWNTTDAETDPNFVDPQPTGFQVTSTGSNMNTNGATYIYMAIRRGPLAVPESATDVFAVDQGDGVNDNPQFVSNFVTDFALWRATTSGANWETAARLTGKKYLRTNSTSAAQGPDGDIAWDFMTGHYNNQRNTSFYSWMWKRAPGYFDVVAYSGTGSATTINHNLGVVPEMMWVKKRSGSNNWKTFHSSLGATKSMELNTTVAAETNGSALWNSTAPTASVFTVGSAGDVNSGSHTYIAYLFATLAGISKVGSFTHSNSSGATNVDCGFSNGARLVIFKRTDSSGDWYVVDSVRGITSGNDPYLELNTTDAEATSTELINPLNAGFTVQQYQGVVDGTYIFYAVAA